MNQLLDLFLTFARIGGLTFGGGYAMLPILQREVVEKRKWATEEECIIRSTAPDCSTFCKHYRLFFFRHKRIRLSKGGNR